MAGLPVQFFPVSSERRRPPPPSRRQARGIHLGVSPSSPEGLHQNSVGSPLPSIPKLPFSKTNWGGRCKHFFSPGKQELGEGRRSREGGGEETSPLGLTASGGLASSGGGPDSFPHRPDPQPQRQRHTEPTGRLTPLGISRCGFNAPKCQHSKVTPSFPQHPHVTKIRSGQEQVAGPRSKDF